jgi:hypothetical protein
VTGSLGRKLARALSAFGEFFFATREARDAGDQAGLQAGLVYVVTPSIAVDAAILTSLIGRAPDYVLRTGLSLRFGR